MSVYFETSEDIAWQEQQRLTGMDPMDDLYPSFELEDDEDPFA